MLTKWYFIFFTNIYMDKYFWITASRMIYESLPPKDGWVNAGGVVVLPNKPPVVEPAGFELKREVLPLPKTGVAPEPKLVVVIGLPNADCPNGLDCVGVLKLPTIKIN